MPLRVTNPYDQSMYRELGFETDAMLEEKMAAARTAFDQWRRGAAGGAHRCGAPGAGLFQSPPGDHRHRHHEADGQADPRGHNEIGGFFRAGRIHAGYCRTDPCP